MIAGANYIDLATASSLRRAKEIGIRKVLGGRQRQLIGQFLGESIFQVFISLIVATCFTILLLPYFNVFTGKNIHLFTLENAKIIWPGIIAATFTLALLAGIYPAFYLAGLRPGRILKQKLDADHFKLRFRQVLVVTQFAICVALIAGTLMVNAQFRFMTNKDPGFTKDQTLILD